MNRFDLNGIWRMMGNGFDITGTVPGSVYSFLIDAGKVPDPYYRYNEKIFFRAFGARVFFRGRGKTVSYVTGIFTAYKHYEWVDPGLSVSLDGDEIVVKSDAYSKYVEVYSEESDFILYDNFFDMEKGEMRIKVLEGKPNALKVRSVYDIR